MSRNPKAICRHCGEFRWTAGRGLCKQCHNTPAIRTLYDISVNTQNRMAEEADLSLVPRCYVPDPCVHGLRDGTCPTCERRQRAAAGIVQEEEDNGED